MPRDSERIKTLIDDIPQLSFLSRDERDVVALYMDYKEFPPKEMICKEGSQGATLYFILNGKVEIKKESLSGSQTVLNHLGKGASLGEMSIIDSGIRSASVVALETTGTLFLARTQFDDILNKYPKIGIKILRKIAAQLCERLRHLSGKYADVVDL